jgi:hypothetical protein
MGVDFLSRQPDSEQPLRRFLLGLSSEEEKTLLEERFFADDAQFEQVEILEDELIDRYVRDELPADDRPHFEQRIANSARLRERVEFAKLFKAKVAAAKVNVVEQPAPVLVAPEPVRKGWRQSLFGTTLFAPPQMAFVSSLIILLVGSTALILFWMNLRGQSNRISSQLVAAEQQKREVEQRMADQRLRTEQLASELQQAREQQAAQEELIEELRSQNQTGIPRTSTTTFLSLIAGATRGVGGGNELGIGPQVRQVRVSLRLDQVDYESYKVTVKTPEGNVVQQKNALKPRRNTLTLQVPTARLSRGDYIVNVEGITSSQSVEPVAAYSFLLKKNSRN